MSEFYFDTIGLEKKIMCALSVLPYSVHSENLSVAVLDSKELPWKGFFQGLLGISIDLDTVRLDNYFCDLLVLLLLCPW